MGFVFSLAEQGFGSLLTFAINLWLIRNGAAQSYGVYVFWLSVAWVLGVAQGTLVIAHIYRLPSARDQLRERRQPERLLLSLALAISAAAGVLAAMGSAALSLGGSELAEPAAALFIPAFLLFQYVRAFAFSRLRPALAAALTTSIFLVSAILLVGDRLLGFEPDAERVLTLTGLAYGGCSMVALLVLAPGLTPMLRPPEIRRHAHIIQGSWWLLLGSAAGEVTTRLYGFAVVGTYGAPALAALSAVQVVIRPAWMLSAAWGVVAYPQMTARHRNGDRSGLIRIMLQGAAMVTAGSAAWCAIVAAAWPWISGELYHGRYMQPGPLIWLWAANVMLGSTALALNNAILAVGEFKRLALIDVAGSAATALAIVAVLSTAPYPYVVVATLVGQATQILLMARVLAGRPGVGRALLV